MNEINWLSKILDMYPFIIFLLMILSLNFFIDINFFFTNFEHFYPLFVQFYCFTLGSICTLFIKILLVNIIKNVFL